MARPTLLVHPIAKPEAYLLSDERQERQIVLARRLRKLTQPFVDRLLEATYRKLGGDPVFEQERVGRNNQNITIKKIKTIPDELSDGSLYRGVTDPRATGISHFARLSHVDELLQLENVEKGEMCLSGGSRPYLEVDLHSLGDLDPDYYAELWRPDYDAFLPSLFGFSALLRHSTGGDWNASNLSQTMGLDRWYWHYAASPATDRALMLATPALLFLHHMPDYNIDAFAPAHAHLPVHGL